MHSIGISQPHQLPDILARAATAFKKGEEFSAVTFPFSPGRFGIRLTEEVRLFVTNRALVTAEGQAAVTRHLREPKPVPPEAIGEIIVGDLLYVHGPDVEPGWPGDVEVALQAHPAGIERPGLIVGVGAEMLSDIRFTLKTDPTFDTAGFIGTASAPTIIETKPL